MSRSSRFVFYTPPPYRSDDRRNDDEDNDYSSSKPHSKCDEYNKCVKNMYSSCDLFYNREKKCKKECAEYFYCLKEGLTKSYCETFYDPKRQCEKDNKNIYY